MVIETLAELRKAITLINIIVTMTLNTLDETKQKEMVDFCKELVDLVKTKCKEILTNINIGENEREVLDQLFKDLEQLNWSS